MKEDENTMLNVGVIGYGYWGPNLVRNFHENGLSRVLAVCDINKDRLNKAAQRYPSIRFATDYHELLRNSSIDAVLISTPVSTHFPIAMEALKAGKHVWIEKPITASSDEALRLIEEAERYKRVLMVDHTFVYTGAVRKIRELVASGELGDLFYYDSVRVNLGLFQHDVNVVWDLAVHDLSILAHLYDATPVAVSATGMCHVPGEAENIAYLTLFFNSTMIAHIHVNWLAPAKIRQTLIGGSRKMIVYNDLEPSEKIKVYDKGITATDSPENVYQILISYRTGDMYIPKLDGTEALKVGASHFIHCIESGEKPLTDGRAGLEVVRVLEAAMLSMSKRGEAVEL